jgi:hypothetical protein
LEGLALTFPNRMLLTGPWHKGLYNVERLASMAAPPPEQPAWPRLHLRHLRIDLPDLLRFSQLKLVASKAGQESLEALFFHVEVVFDAPAGFLRDDALAPHFG